MEMEIGVVVMGDWYAMRDGPKSMKRWWDKIRGKQRKRKIAGRSFGGGGFVFGWLSQWVLSFH